MSKNDEKSEMIKRLLEQQTRDILNKVEAIVAEKLEPFVKESGMEEINRKQLIQKEEDLERELKIKEQEPDQLFLLKADNDHLKKELQNLRKNYEEIQNEKLNLESKYRQQREQIQEFENMKQQVGEFYDIFDLYQKLSFETKEELNNLFQKNTAVGIVVPGLQWSGIESLWNYIRIKIINGNERDTENLLKLFKKMFQLYNEAFRKPIYSLIDPCPGERFDSERHTIIGIKTDGKVRKVRLAGFMNNRTGKIANKAIIEV